MPKRHFVSEGRSADGHISLLVNGSLLILRNNKEMLVQRSVYHFENNVQRFVRDLVLCYVCYCQINLIFHMLEINFL